MRLCYKTQGVAQPLTTDFVPQTSFQLLQRRSLLIWTDNLDGVTSLFVSLLRLTPNSVGPTALPNGLLTRGDRGDAGPSLQPPTLPPECSPLERGLEAPLEGLFVDLPASGRSGRGLQLGLLGIVLFAPSSWGLRGLLPGLSGLDWLGLRLWRTSCTRGADRAKVRSAPTHDSNHSSL